MALLFSFGIFKKKILPSRISLYFWGTTFDLFLDFFSVLFFFLELLFSLTLSSSLLSSPLPPFTGYASPLHSWLTLSGREWRRRRRRRAKRRSRNSRIPWSEVACYYIFLLSFSGCFLLPLCSLFPFTLIIMSLKFFLSCSSSSCLSVCIFLILFSFLSSAFSLRS